MRKALVIAVLMVVAAPALHALSPSCDVFQRTHQGWDKTRLEQASQTSGEKLVRQYVAASQNVVQAFCGAQPADAGTRARASEAFVSAYAAVRFNNLAYPAFQTRMGLQMLSLIAMSHQVPERLQNDIVLREAWMQDCQDACFTVLTSDATEDQRSLVRAERVVRDEVMDNLQTGPGIPAIKRMLWESSSASLN